MSWTPRSQRPVLGSDRARAIRIQRIVVITFAAIEAIAIAWALF